MAPEFALYIEMPVSFQFCLDQLIQNNDSNCYEDFFKNIYSRKDEELSAFWLDFKNSLYHLLEYCRNNGIILNIYAIDSERSYRRTAFILNEVRKDYDLNHAITTDSLQEFLEKDFISNKKENKEFLIEQSELMGEQLSGESNATRYLKEIINSLKIPIGLTQERDSFMVQNFMKYYSDNPNNLNVVSLGLLHITSKRALVVEGNPLIAHLNKTKIDSSKTFTPFIMLLPEYIQKAACKVVIGALDHSVENYPFPSKKNIHGLSNEENEFLRELIPLDQVKRFSPKGFTELKQCKRYFDYLIVYGRSHYK